MNTTLQKPIMSRDAGTVTRVTKAEIRKMKPQMTTTEFELWWRLVGVKLHRVEKTAAEKRVEKLQREWEKAHAENPQITLEAWIASRKIDKARARAEYAKRRAAKAAEKAERASKAAETLSEMMSACDLSDIGSIADVIPEERQVDEVMLHTPPSSPPKSTDAPAPRRSLRKRK